MWHTAHCAACRRSAITLKASRLCSGVTSWLIRFLLLNPFIWNTIYCLFIDSVTFLWMDALDFIFSIVIGILFILWVRGEFKFLKSTPEDYEKQMWFVQNILKVRPKISKQGRIIWRVVFWFLIIFVFCCYISSKNISS